MSTTIDTTARTTGEPTVSSASFGRLTDHNYAESACRGNWGYVHFSESGKLRLLHTIGWLEAMEVSDPETAYSLASDLCRYLDRFGEYGGMIDSPEGRTDVHGQPLQFPRYRLVLSDDGGLGSFGVLWYVALPHEDFMEAAERIADEITAERHGGKTYADLDRENADVIWQDALDATRRHFRIDEELTVDRGYFPDWDKDRKWYSREYMYYAFSHNGALVYHYGDDITGGSWSSHT